MNNFPAICTVTLLAIALLPVESLGQDAEADQAAVWAAVEASWTADERGDDEWFDDMLVGDFMGWPDNAPAPLSKASTRMWDDFNERLFQGITHELYPLSIVVHGDTAVAHYLYTNAVELQDKTIRVANGRYTDVLVREDDAWKYLAWHGGDDD